MRTHSAGWLATAIFVLSTLGAFAQAGTAPAAPTGLAVQSVTDSTVTLTWNGSAGASIYWIQSSLDGISWTVEGQERPVGDLTAQQTFTLPGWRPGSVHYVSVVAVNTAGQAACKPVKAVTNLLGLPTLTATVKGTTVTLTWPQFDGAATYTVQRRALSGVAAAFAPAVTLGPNNKSYTDAGLTAGTGYEYELVAANAGTDTATSLPVSVTVTATPLTLTPATVTLAPGGTQTFTLASAAGLTCTATGGSVSVTLQYTAPTKPGTYTVSATAGGQTASATVTVK